MKATLSNFMKIKSEVIPGQPRPGTRKAVGREQAGGSVIPRIEY